MSDFYPPRTLSRVKAELNSYFAMDMKYVNSDHLHKRHSEENLFDKPNKVDFDYQSIQSIWNNVLNMDIDTPSHKFKELHLSAEDEKTLFMQFNYAKMRVAKIKALSEKRKLSRQEVARAIKWGRKMKELKDILVVANIGLVLSMCKRYNLFKGLPGKHSDVVAEGINAVMRSVDRFDTTTGFKFSTYACRAIIKAGLRVREKHITQTSKEIAADFVEDAAIANIEYTIHEELVRKDDIEYVRHILDTNPAELSDVELLILRKRFYENATLESIGKLISVTKERVRQIQNSSLDKLRDVMREDIAA